MTRALVLLAVAAPVGAAALWWRRAAARRRPPDEAAGVGLSDGWMIFSARFCGTCRQLVDRLEEAGEPVVEIDIDARPDLTAAHDVTTVPTVVRLRSGMVVDGAAGRQRSADVVAAYLRDRAGR